MPVKEEAKEYLKSLKQIWKKLEKTPDIFAYNLRIVNKKYLPGRLKFYSELNPQRSTLRRPPQVIPSLNPTFDESKFNFMKVNQMEVMFKIPYGENEISMIINKSPLTKYHTLICPDVEDGIPQRITRAALAFCIKFLIGLENPDYRIGYNSPGALASVNHLHLHLVKMKKDLYIDNCELEPLTDSYVYRLSKEMPTHAICFVFDKRDSDEVVDTKAANIYNYLIWLCDNQHPHNLFITWGRRNEYKNMIKVFVYARENYCIIKDTQSFNVGFAELSGFVPFGLKSQFKEFTDEMVVEKIVEETGRIYEKIYDFFTKEPSFEEDTVEGTPTDGNSLYDENENVENMSYETTNYLKETKSRSAANLVSKQGSKTLSKSSKSQLNLTNSKPNQTMDASSQTVAAQKSSTVVTSSRSSHVISKKSADPDPEATADTNPKSTTNPGVPIDVPNLTSVKSVVAIPATSSVSKNRTVYGLDGPPVPITGPPLNDAPKPSSVPSSALLPVAILVKNSKSTTSSTVQVSVKNPEVNATSVPSSIPDSVIAPKPLTDPLIIKAPAPNSPTKTTPAIAAIEAPKTESVAAPVVTPVNIPKADATPISTTSNTPMKASGPEPVPAPASDPKSALVKATIEAPKQITVKTPDPSKQNNPVSSTSSALVPASVANQKSNSVGPLAISKDTTAASSPKEPAPVTPVAANIKKPIAKAKPVPEATSIAKPAPVSLQTPKTVKIAVPLKSAIEAPVPVPKTDTNTVAVRDSRALRLFIPAWAPRPKPKKVETPPPPPPPPNPYANTRYGLDGPPPPETPEPEVSAPSPGLVANPKANAGPGTVSNAINPKLQTNVSPILPRKSPKATKAITFPKSSAVAGTNRKLTSSRVPKLSTMAMAASKQGLINTTKRPLNTSRDQKSGTSKVPKLSTIATSKRGPAATGIALKPALITSPNRRLTGLASLRKNPIAAAIIDQKQVRPSVHKSIPLKASKSAPETSIFADSKLLKTVKKPRASVAFANTNAPLVNIKALNTPGNGTPHGKKPPIIHPKPILIVNPDIRPDLVEISRLGLDAIANRGRPLYVNVAPPELPQQNPYTKPRRGRSLTLNLDPIASKNLKKSSKLTQKSASYSNILMTKSDLEAKPKRAGSLHRSKSNTVTGTVSSPVLNAGKKPTPSSTSVASQKQDPAAKTKRVPSLTRNKSTSALPSKVKIATSSPVLNVIPKPTPSTSTVALPKQDLDLKPKRTRSLTQSKSPLEATSIIDETGPSTALNVSAKSTASSTLTALPKTDQDTKPKRATSLARSKSPIVSSNTILAVTSSPIQNVTQKSAPSVTLTALAKPGQDGKPKRSVSLKRSKSLNAAPNTIIDVALSPAINVTRKFALSSVAPPSQDLNEEPQEACSVIQRVTSSEAPNTFQDSNPNAALNSITNLESISDSGPVAKQDVEVKSKRSRFLFRRKSSNEPPSDIEPSLALNLTENLTASAPDEAVPKENLQTNMVQKYSSNSVAPQRQNPSEKPQEACSSKQSIPPSETLNVLQVSDPSKAVNSTLNLKSNAPTVNAEQDLEVKPKRGRSLFRRKSSSDPPSDSFPDDSNKNLTDNLSVPGILEPNQNLDAKPKRKRSWSKNRSSDETLPINADSVLSKFSNAPSHRNLAVNLADNLSASTPGIADPNQDPEVKPKRKRSWSRSKTSDETPSSNADKIPSVPDSVSNLPLPPASTIVPMQDPDENLESGRSLQRNKSLD